MLYANRNVGAARNRHYWRGFKDGMAALTVVLIGMVVVFTLGVMV